MPIQSVPDGVLDVENATLRASGMVATKDMVAAAGRSSYVPVEVMKTVPDPGATAAAAWIRGVAIAIA